MARPKAVIPQKRIPLKVARAERQLTQHVVALGAKMSLAKYWQIENGLQDGNEDDRKAIARSIGVTVATVFPDMTSSGG